MQFLLPLVIQVNCLLIQGILEWTVIGKVTKYGQNVTLFCNVSNCCPKYAGWDRLTPVQQTLFIDVKTGRSNKKYDGKALRNGYTLVIQNLTKQDLNVSYSCVYGATLGEEKYLLEEDVFTSTSTTKPNIPNGNSKLSTDEMAALITGIIILVSVSVTIAVHFYRRRIESNRYKGKPDSTELEEHLLDKETEQKGISACKLTDTLTENEDTLNLKDIVLGKKTEIKEQQDYAHNIEITVILEQEDCVPKNIRNLRQRQIRDWKKTDEKFVSTRASDFVMTCLRENNCLTLTAPSGAGKSVIAKHIALILQKEGYTIIPVNKPVDIRDYYQPGKQTVFIIDDICGNFTANQQQIDNWKQFLPVINTIVTDTCCKIIVACRLLVFKDDKLDILVPFKTCECNLLSDKLCLTSEEKHSIAKTYINSSLDDIHVSQNSEIFPLLCYLYHEGKRGDLKEFFKNPFEVYKNELDSLGRHDNRESFKLYSLALVVIFNNQLEEKWFRGKITGEQKQIIKETCEAGEFNTISKVTLKKNLDTLVGTFVSKHYGVYTTIHDKLFDFLAHYFGHRMIECLIKYGESDLVRERFIWQKSPGDKISNIDFIIEIPDDFLESYLQRLIKDWTVGKVTNVFCNTNMKMSSFRKKFLEILEKMDKLQQVTLANTKDTEVPHEYWDSGTTALILTCYRGYTDMVQWLLDNDVDVDQCQNGRSALMLASQNGHTYIVKLLLEKDSDFDLLDNDGSSSLLLASQNGHTDIVKLLLGKDSNVDICDMNDCSSLFWASHEGHTDIVKLLLEKDPNVDLCNIDGCSPLKLASLNGNTDVVRLLLEKNPNVNISDKNGLTPLISSCINNNTMVVQLLMKYKPDVNKQTYDGGSALYFSAKNGNKEITQILLENNADFNLCAHNKHIITEKLNNFPFVTLDEYKQSLFDSLVNDTLSHATDYVRNKSVEYIFDVEAGSSPLHIACFLGRIDVTRCLLNKNADINMTKEDGTTPLFYACELGHTDIVHLLLHKGANSQICRIDEKFPLDIATDNGHTSIVMMLTDYTKKRRPVPL